MAYEGLGFESFAADADTDRLLAYPEDEHHGVRMGWPVRPCRLLGDYVVAASAGSWNDYNPFRFYYPYGSAKESEGSRSLYLRLADLAASPDAALLDFCAHYGLPDYPMDIVGVRRWDHDSFGAVAYPLDQLRALAVLLSELMAILDLWAKERFGGVLNQLPTLDRAVEPLRQTRGWVDGHVWWGSELDTADGFSDEPSDGTEEGLDEAADDTEEDADRRTPDVAFLYWTGRRSDDVHGLATRWGVTWNGQRLSALVADYWDDYHISMVERCHTAPDWATTGYRRELQSLQWRDASEADRARAGLRYLLREIWLMGDPRRASYDSLEAALLSMLLRDVAGGGHFVKCPECGRSFYAQHGRQRYCPPDPAAGNPKGCAKRRADRLAQQRRRAACARGKHPAREQE